MNDQTPVPAPLGASVSDVQPKAAHGATGHTARPTEALTAERDRALANFALEGQIADALAAERDAALAEVARLREGIDDLARTGEMDGRGNSRDLAKRLRTLLADEDPR